ncbi:hypothetical protein GGGNBK_18990 [Sporosarcina sp. ANT_H38]|nr:hypothetical protein [Sporosarcina sp. ANT_H38]
MLDHEREQIITLLIVWTGWNESAFRAMDDVKLLAEYHRRLAE